MEEISENLHYAYTSQTFRFHSYCINNINGLFAVMHWCLLSMNLGPAVLPEEVYLEIWTSTTLQTATLHLISNCLHAEVQKNLLSVPLSIISEDAYLLHSAVTHIFDCERGSILTSSHLNQRISRLKRCFRILL